MTNIILIAKECVPGAVKTRLHPPLSLEQAARLAAASLSDTLAALAQLPATRRILAFDGSTPPAGSESYEVIEQADGGLDERLAAVFDECTGPTILVGMDTPQLRPELLRPYCERWPDGVDAVLGFANDGGFWVLGMARPDGALIRGVPMSQDDTGALQLERLRAAGLRVRLVEELTDVDTIDDANAVAADRPDGLFAATLRGVTRERGVNA